MPVSFSDLPKSQVYKFVQGGTQYFGFLLLPVDAVTGDFVALVYSQQGPDNMTPVMTTSILDGKTVQEGSFRMWNARDFDLIEAHKKKG